MEEFGLYQWIFTMDSMLKYVNNIIKQS